MPLLCTCPASHTCTHSLPYLSLYTTLLPCLLPKSHYLTSTPMQSATPALPVYIYTFASSSILHLTFTSPLTIRPVTRTPYTRTHTTPFLISLIYPATFRLPHFSFAVRNTLIYTFLSSLIRTATPSHLTCLTCLYRHTFTSSPSSSPPRGCHTLTPSGLDAAQLLSRPKTSYIIHPRPISCLVKVLPPRHLLPGLLPPVLPRAAGTPTAAGQ